MTLLLPQSLINARSLSNKTFILNDFFTAHRLDFLLVTETWLNVGDFVPLVEVCPDDCHFLSTPRPSGRGGGLAAVFKNHFNCRLLYSDQFSSFEVQLIKVGTVNPLLIALVYRPPKMNRLYSTFCGFSVHYHAQL